MKKCVLLILTTVGIEYVAKLHDTVTVYLSRNQTFGTVKHEEHSQNM